MSCPSSGRAFRVPILYHDDSMLVVDKPAELPVEPPEDGDFALLPWIRDAIKREAASVRPLGLEWVGAAHWVDDGSSGILVIGTSSKATEALHNQFYGSRQILTYHAWVHGTPIQESWQMAEKIAPDKRRLDLYCVSEACGKKSMTKAKVLHHFPRYTLVELKPFPDRRHQINVHMKALGHPIVGDARYGGAPLYLSQIKPTYRFKKDRDERPLIGRPATHVHDVLIVSPSTEKERRFQASYPKDFELAARYLERYSR